MTLDAMTASSGVLRAAETRLSQQPRIVGQLSQPEERHQVAVTRGDDGIEVIHVACPCGRHVDLKLVSQSSK
jgi:hypothetical protein